MPFVAFETIEDAESYEFEGFGIDFHESCKKEFCWVHDDVWNFLTNFVTYCETHPETISSDCGEYFLESVKIYFTLRLKNFKIVHLNVHSINETDDSKDYFLDSTIKNYLPNNTIEFMIGLVESVINAPFPVNTDRDQEQYNLLVSELTKIIKSCNTTPSEFIKTLTILNKADELVDDMYLQLKNFNVTLFSRYNDLFDKYSNSELLEKIQFIIKGGEKYSVESFSDFVLSSEVEQEINDSVSLMKDFLNNIVIAVGDKINDWKKSNKIESAKLTENLSKEIAEFEAVQNELKNSTDRQDKLRLIGKSSSLSISINQLRRDISDHEPKEYDDILGDKLNIKTFVTERLNAFYEAFGLIKKHEKTPDAPVDIVDDEFGFKAKLANLKKESNKAFFGNFDTLQNDE